MRRIGRGTGRASIAYRASAPGRARRRARRRRHARSAGIISPPRLPCAPEPGIDVSRAIAKQAASAAFCALVSFLLLALLARWLGPAEFGRYVWLLSLAVLMLIAIEGGWPALLYREAARLPADAALPSAPAAVRHVLLVAAGAAALAATLAGTDLALAAGCMGGVALANLVSARLRGAGRFGREGLWQSGLRLITAAAIVFALWRAAAAASTVFAAWGLALLLCVLPVAWKVLRPARGAARSAWHASLGLVALEAALVLLQRGDMAALGLLPLPAETLAHYAAGTRVTELAVLAFAPLTNVTLRPLRQAWPERERFLSRLRPALLAAAMVGAAAFLAALAFGDTLLALAFGEPYRQAGALLPWILAALPFLLAQLVLAQAAIAQGREAGAAGLLLAGAVLTLLAFAIGATHHGPRTAAAAMAAGQAMLAGLALRGVLRARAARE